MAPTPPYVLRVWSSRSHGINTPSLFAPESLATPTGQPRTISAERPHPQPVTASELLQALIGRQLPQNRIVFFTDSLLYASQFAAQKKSDGWPDIQITFVCTSTASTAGRKPVVFQTAPNLIRKYGVQTRTTRDGKICDYEGEWLVFDSQIILGAGSSIVDFDVLLQRGLYSLYPELGQQASRHRVHLYSALRSVRQYCLASGRSWALDDGAMSVAAKLATASKPIQFSGISSAAGEVPTHLLAHLLALRTRVAYDPVLVKWIAKRASTGTIRVSGAEAPNTSSWSTLPEIAQYLALHTLLDGKKLRLQPADLTARISSASVSQALAQWQAWGRASHDATRTSREPADSTLSSVYGGRVEKRRGHERGNGPWREYAGRGIGRPERTGFRERERREGRYDRPSERTYGEHRYRRRGRS